MNQRQLSYFLEVYKKRNISHAAKELYISPQGLSKTIAGLEKELGVELFVHESNRIVPTQAAAKLAIHATSLINEYNLITDRLFLEDNSRKILHIACSYDVPRLFTPEEIMDFIRDNPSIVLKFQEHPDKDIKRLLKNGQVELALFPGPFNSKHYEYETVTAEPFYLIVNREHPLAAKESVTVRDINGLPMVVKDSENSTSRVHLMRFKNAGVDTNIILESSDNNLIRQMIEHNFAVGMMLRYNAEIILNEKLRAIPFEEKWMHKTIFIVKKAGTPLSAEARLFKEYFF
ncbi:MAG: LysR family transcriptional regulator [Eubacterium sp.]|nr:LysR family transcriptional regulator [Eubacterium sp.]